MAQYVLLLHGADFKHYSPEEMQKILAKYIGWADDLRRRGIHRGGEELNRTGRILRLQNGQVVDGPFTETKEAVGGFFMFEAKDYNEAVTISKDCPHFQYGGYVELREVIPH